MVVSERLLLVALTGGSGSIAARGPKKPVRRLSAAIRSLAQSSRSVVIWTAGQRCKPTVRLRGALTAADPDLPDAFIMVHGGFLIRKPPVTGI